MNPDDREKDLPPPHDTLTDPEYRLSEDPAFLKLVSSVVKEYEFYITALAAAIHNVEDKQKLEEEIGELEDSQYKERFRKDADEYAGTNLSAALKRMGEINLATHIYGIKNWHAVLAALHNMHKHFEGNESEKAEIAALFEKTKTVNDKIFRNLSGFSNAIRQSDALSIEELNALPEGKPITPFTAREWELLIAALQRILNQQTQVAEQKISAKDARLAECRTNIETLNIQKPQLFEDSGRKLAPLVHSLSQQMDEEYKRVKPVEHGTLNSPRSLYWRFFQNWKKEILGRARIKLRRWDFEHKLKMSLENELGWASNNNHFDVFFVDNEGMRVFTQHVHAVLDMQLFLVLANEYFDVEIFKGELRPIEEYRAEGRTADFIIPKNGVLQAGILRR